MRAVVYSDGSEYAVQQTLTGLPAGWYRLSAQGLGGQPNDKTHNALYLFANNGSEEKSVAFDTYNITAATSAQTIENYFAEENNQKYKKSVDVLVGDDGTLIIGAKCGEKKNAASFFDNFELEYLGTMSAEEVAAIPYNVSIPYGILDLDGRNIQGLLEKPKYTYYANAGIYLIKRRALNEIPQNTFFNATDLVEKLISKGKSVIRYPLNGTWIDIGNPQEYQKAQDLVKHM